MDDKNNKKRVTTTIIVVISVILILIAGWFCLNRNDGEVTVNQPTISTHEVSNNQGSITDPNNHAVTQGETTDIVGFGELDITKEMPNVYLQNPEGNTVFMQFDVTYEDELIYSSELIKPGHQELLSVYDKCKNGHQVLNYSITTYDVNTRELCMAGISQQQKINVIK